MKTIDDKFTLLPNRDTGSGKSHALIHDAVSLRWRYCAFERVPLPGDLPRIQSQRNEGHETPAIGAPVTAPLESEG